MNKYVQADLIRQGSSRFGGILRPPALRFIGLVKPARLRLSCSALLLQCLKLRQEGLIFHNSALAYTAGKSNVDATCSFCSASPEPTSRVSWAVASCTASTALSAESASTSFSRALTFLTLLSNNLSSCSRGRAAILLAEPYKFR